MHESKYRCLLKTIENTYKFARILFLEQICKTRQKYKKNINNSASKIIKIPCANSFVELDKFG
jgi:hypothetical protein